MSHGSRGPRGPYSKGVAKRHAILEAALDLYAKSDGMRPTLRAIADAVSLSEAGVLHYFGSVDDLLVAVLEARDEQAAATYNLTSLEGVTSYLAATTTEPGLTALFVDMSVAATAPRHPAADFMRRHRARAEAVVRLLLGPAAGHEDAALAVAAAEGLQLRWTLDQSVDVAGLTRTLLIKLQASQRARG